MSKVDQVQITSEVLKQEVIETPTLKEINLWVFLVFFFFWGKNVIQDSFSPILYTGQEIT